MRIVSWNMHFANRHTHKAIEALQAFAPDVVCLQEVSAENLPLLREGLELPYVAIAEDYLHTGINTYVVTLSRYPFTESLALSTPSPRTRFHRWVGGREGQQTLATTLDVDGKKVRILNVHLPLHLPPSRRLDIVESFLKSSEKPDVFCGDFNSCGRPWLAPFVGVWHNYKMADYACHEQRRLLRLMQRYDMANPLGNKRTHATIPFPLDGVYVARSRAKNWQGQRGKSRLGSDHWPLYLEVDFKLRD